MPLHDWTRVDAGIFHAFHHDWITELARALNRGSLPSDYYALPEPGGRRPEPSVVEQYTAKAKVVAIHHVTNHRVVALVEVLSPGNKSNRNGMRAFVRKAVDALEAGVHLLLVDLFPPGPRDPEGIHPAIWEELLGEADQTFAAVPDLPLTLAAYCGGASPQAFIELVAIGSVLPDMPLFLTPESYIQTPLENTYQLAWQGLPRYWRDVLERHVGL